MKLTDLPTHIALVNQRLNISGADASAETFLFTSYLAEATIKSIAACLHSGLLLGSPDDAYRIAHTLINADGLGPIRQQSCVEFQVQGNRQFIVKVES
jgi:hypothetical protein